jgi:glycosyltransferase involved in cell wall biosynthesis
MLPRSANVKSLVSAHNVDSLIWQRYYETEQNLLRRIILKSQWKKFVRFEKRALSKATRVAAVSEIDANLLRRDFGIPHVDVVENGVDVDYYSSIHYSSIHAVRDPHKLLFLGSLDWRPNLDAINTLLDEIMPRLRRTQPLVKLEIVGRNPPRWLADKLAVQQDITLHANVPDVRPFLATAGMMVVPLRIGGGSRLKILEALASSLPVVSSTIGAEGLELTPVEDLQIADTPDAMVQAILQWMLHPALAATTAQRGFEVVKNHYDWERLAQVLESVWEKTVNSTNMVASPC